MPTDLPPDYKPKPVGDTGNAPDSKDPSAPAPPAGGDVVDGKPGVPQPGQGTGGGLPGSDGDVVDPIGVPGAVPAGAPVPAGLPTF